MSSIKRRITYNTARLALFLRSYSVYVILKQFKDKLDTRTIKRLSNVLNLDTHLLNKFFISSKYPKELPNLNRLTKYLVPKEKMLIYLEIEQEIINLTIEKQDMEKTSLEDYEKAIMEPAIERVAGNHLKNVKDDKVFDAQLEELKRKYQNWYYTTAYKYKLPTSRIIPFILRLIQN
ncbi:MAG: hypothetical protein Q7R43_06295 [Candidatus Daviesbacteria bacterium]|nr:hypothetical protein [Candidatus Daviesbacteria bacterium]